MGALTEAMTVNSKHDEGDLELMAEDALKLGLLAVAIPSNASSMSQLTQHECALIRNGLEHSIKKRPVPEG